MKQSWAQQVFLAEEIARGIKVEIGDVIVPEIKIPEPLKTEEIRPKSPQIINHNLIVANKWYELKIPINAVTWKLRCRNNYDILYSYSPAHATYFTLKRDEIISADTAPKDIEQSEYGSIFVTCETAGAVMELEYWQK